MPPKPATPYAAQQGASGRRGYSIVNDTFGMLGLHNTLQASDSDPGMILMTRGFDLHTLGLPLAQQEPFHPTFSSPWSDAQVKVQPDYKLPQCYFVNPPHLKFAMFQKFNLHTLFYVFYSMPRDVLQLAAAQELHNREWWFHKGEKLWMSRVPDSEHMKTKELEKGSYNFFNPTKWAVERRDEYVLHYIHMEDRSESGPPRTASQNVPAVPPPQPMPGAGAPAQPVGPPR
jgi:CCR4-NOT transcription complex subunit 2